MKQYIGEEEWENFQPPDSLSPEISGKLWNSINKNTASSKVHHSYWRWMAVAASVLLVVGLSWYFISTKQETDLISAAAIGKIKSIFNNTSQKMMLALSDGSTIELSPNSTLSYPENFNTLKRDVTLTGEANFNVAKEVGKPFCVHGNSVLITVLGTRFTVKSHEANGATKVILHEGSVMVRVPNSSSRDHKNEYYLTPGDIFIVKKVTAPAGVSQAALMASRQYPSGDSLSARILHLEKDKDECYVFNNYPLDVVFDQLQIIYNTKIIYDKAELGNRSFIGKIDGKDSLSHILKSITLLNKFGLSKQGDSFIVANPY